MTRQSAAERNGRIGGLTTAARGHTTTHAAREARWARFLKEVDPDNQLAGDERVRRARAAERAYMARLSAKRWGRPAQLTVIGGRAE